MATLGNVDPGEDLVQYSIDGRLSTGGQTSGESLDEGDGNVIGIVLVACPADLSGTLDAVIKSANYRVAADPSMTGALVFLGPQKLRRTSRWKRLFRSRESESVWHGFQLHVGSVKLESSQRVALGLVVVDHDVESLEVRLRELTAAPDLGRVPIPIHGISLSPTNQETGEDVITTDLAKGSLRLDRLLINRGEAILGGAALSPDTVLPVPLLANIIPSVKVVSEHNRSITVVPMAEDGESARHSARVAAYHALSDERPQASSVVPRARPVSDKYTVPENLPLRLTYIVVALGEESRPRHIRKRITELVVALDHALIPQQNTFASRTILVPAGQGAIRGGDPLMRVTGEIHKGDIRPPSTDYLDVTQTMEELAKLIRENVASYDRRGQSLERPLVLFVMPTAALPGARCQSSYGRITEIAEVAWLVTDPAAGSASIEVDPTLVFADKEDVVSELLDAVGYPLVNVSEGDPLTRGASDLG